jgi:hypothetical protein
MSLSIYNTLPFVKQSTNTKSLPSYSTGVADAFNNVALEAWSSGIISACGAMGREIESCQKEVNTGFVFHWVVIVADIFVFRTRLKYFRRTSSSSSLDRP